MNLPLSLHSGKLSLFQSALNKIIQDKGQSSTQLSEDHAMMQQANTVLQAAYAGKDLSQFLDTPLECASLSVRAALAFAAGDTAEELRIRAQLQDSPCDIGWITALTAFEAYYACGQTPKYTNWTDIGDFVYSIADSGRNQLTVAVLADWGSGDPAMAKSSLDARKIILLSHHQLYSAFKIVGKQANNYYNPNLLSNFQDGMTAEAITAWFWGHEHLLELYGTFPLLNANQPKGRCIGYSAFPMMKSPNPYDLLVTADKLPLLADPPFLETTQDVYDHGFMILTLAVSYAKADYYQIPGDGAAAKDPLYPKYSETLCYAQSAAAQSSSAHT